MSDGAAAAFADVPATTAGHFGLCFHAAVYRLLDHLRRLAGADGEGARAVLERHPFLAHYGATIRRYLPPDVSWDDALAWWDRALVTWEGDAPDHLPLVALARDGAIGVRERGAMFLVGLGEEDARFGSLFATLQEPPGRRRPSLELLRRLVANGGLDDDPDAAGVCRRLLDAGLVEVVDRDAPRAEWELRVPALLWETVRDGAPGTASWYAHRPAATLPALEDLVLPDALRRRLQQAAALLACRGAAALVVRGTPGSDRRDILAAVARALGRGVIELTASALAGAATPLGPLCTMTGAMPVVVCDPLPGETVALPSFAGYRGPSGIALGAAGGVGGAIGPDAITISLATPTAEERRRHWTRAFGAHPVADVATVSDRFCLPPAYLRQVAAGAVVRARLDGRDAVAVADVADASRALNREMLDTLAGRVDVDGSWDGLVVTPATGDRLADLARRCRHREALAAQAGRGAGAAASRGVRALFAGASGTGKTLAARILAADLGMDLYRVDLAAVVNKYIGETEKNLHRVLTAAEELDVILLLDEGDALLGHRTEVRSSNDRWANLETDFLLQRLEAYQGICVVTTNVPDHIDPAFQRRIDVVVHFVPPQAPERLRILGLHLPADHAIPAAELERIAARCAMTGAQIRNAALEATLLALDERGAAVQARHLEAAILAEYRKAGAVCPLRDDPRPGPVAGAVDAFVRALAAEAV